MDAFAPSWADTFTGGSLNRCFFITLGDYTAIAIVFGLLFF